MTTAPGAGQIRAAGADPGPGVHPIEVESYRLLAERVDLSDWPAGPAAVVARVVHATAEPALARSLVVDEAATRAGAGALGTGAPVLCDVEMVRVGITGADARCLLGEVTAAGSSPSRSAAAMALALARQPQGAVVVVGCAPTALDEACRLMEAGAARPALVVGVPVGFVGAAESKDRLQRTAGRLGVPFITLTGERGGAAVAAAAVNALVRLGGRSSARRGPADGVAPTTGVPPAERGPADGAPPALCLMGHGTRSAAGEVELRRFAEAVATGRPGTTVRAGYIEFCEPGLDEALDQAVQSGARQVIGVPLVLLGAGHMKDDGPAALLRGRHRHPGVEFAYARDFGPHPSVLSVVGERIGEASARFGDGRADAVVVVGRGSSDPDANADLAKAARLLADGRGLGDRLGHGLGEGLGDPVGERPATPPVLGLVEPAFVSLARPGVEAALERCFRQGARRIVVTPYFLFTGLLVDRMAEQARRWSASRPGTEIAMGGPMGADPRLVDLAWARYDEARLGPVHMNCDGCLFRAPLPGYEHRVGAPPFTPSAPPRA